MAKKNKPPGDDSEPKSTRPPAENRRPPVPETTTDEAGNRKLDAQPDRVDVRDWFYQPRLTPLPDRIVNCDLVPGILNQGQEGACTGFALAGVINYLLKARSLDRQISPRMLYEMARRYDEWPGEDYEGATARGAMIGWAKHGVCGSELWPHTLKGPENFRQEMEDDARLTPGGAFYRVMHRQVRDMHAALHEAGILYATLMVHRGWFNLGKQEVKVAYESHGNFRERSFPVIRRQGPADSGHAIAIVGYTHQGFIIQNSWGKGWGKDGFALLPYEDYMLHACDVWVAQLGVPVEMNLWVDEDASDTTAGIQRASRAIPLNEIRPYVVDIGNDGKLSMSGEYWTTEEDLRRMFTGTIPQATAGWAKKRVLLYLHGGLNDESSVARRVVGFRDIMLANQIYPLHIMWETGSMETIKGIISDWSPFRGRAEGVAEWIDSVREGAIEAKDRTLELTAAVPGTAMWKKMKTNAMLASHSSDGKGGMQLILKHVMQALAPLSAADRKGWELHVVGHSAGSIFAAATLSMLADLGLSFKTLQFMAPAITVADFQEYVMPSIRARTCPQPTLYNLSDVGERDDVVGPYGKSLLYLVSNAFEGAWGTPLLGMERFISRASLARTDEDRVDPEIDQLFRKKVDGLPSLVIAGRDEGDGSRSRSDSHGGFDNDPATLNSVLFRILGKPPTRAFTVPDLQF